MRRTDRLFEIIQILRNGKLHRAQDIAARLEVSTRTIYRDMDTLMASGVPVEGERGVGYMVREAITLPPLTLTPAELEALNLGMAIVAEAADTDLKMAAESLAAKIDAVLPTETVAEADSWKFAVYPFADVARGLAQMPTLRAAIKARQKLFLRYRRIDGVLTERVIRPLQMEYWGRVWTVTAWCETRAAFRVFRVDLIETAEALPELFVDEPGKRLQDYDPMCEHEARG
ncbi:helix-turn-helix transcriptional regulator [Tritonibacter horizontis]|uniref:Bifunctional ligase/repressor BirA n=1 Tax=Tritonibacter horizontis TaxID=1768241 RepID=A0A132BZS9_9RHOB|nr:YafY family protein [Tritonibacter horizontis]KUP93859.1 bifunctional ligase/repressor BirA [Tritonibacter horizontis]